MFVYGTMTVANNAALDSGGGVYLYQSELITVNCSVPLKYSTIMQVTKEEVYMQLVHQS